MHSPDTYADLLRHIDAGVDPDTRIFPCCGYKLVRAAAGRVRCHCGVEHIVADLRVHSLVHEACYWRESLGILTRIIVGGGLTDSEGSNGVTPAHVAVEVDNYGALALLIDAGADVNRRDLWDETPANRACMSPYTVSFRMLTAVDADTSNPNAGNGRLPDYLLGVADEIFPLLAVDRSRHALAQLPGPSVQICGDLGLPSAIAWAVLKW